MTAININNFSMKDGTGASLASRIGAKPKGCLADERGEAVTSDASWRDVGVPHRLAREHFGRTKPFGKNAAESMRPLRLRYNAIARAVLAERT